MRFICFFILVLVSSRAFADPLAFKLGEHKLAHSTVKFTFPGISRNLFFVNLTPWQGLEEGKLIKGVVVLRGRDKKELDRSSSICFGTRYKTMSKMAFSKIHRGNVDTVAFFELKTLACPK